MKKMNRDKSIANRYRYDRYFPRHQHEQIAEIERLSGVNLTEPNTQSSALEAQGSRVELNQAIGDVALQAGTETDSISTL